MSGTVAELWADLIDGDAACAGSPGAANPANVANREQARGVAGDSGICERLRITANSEAVTDCAALDSQKNAAIRKPTDGLQSKQTRGVSQNSQDSQWSPGEVPKPAPSADLSAVAWSEADAARFLDRRDRLLRWGWAEVDAERLAERLVICDREADARVSCADCTHYRPGRCGNHRLAGLNVSHVGRDFVALLQHCTGIERRSELGADDTVPKSSGASCV